MINKFQDFLNEKVESDNYLYHFTTFTNLLQILKSDILKSYKEPSIESEDFNGVDIQYKNKSFISFTRDKDLKFKDVRLKFNLTKLKNHFKVIKFNFLEFYREESEERIYNDIPNIKEFIEEIAIRKSKLKILESESEYFQILYKLKENIPIKII